MKLQSINPATEELLGEYDYLSAEQVTSKLRSLRVNDRWALCSAADRAAAIKKIGEEVSRGAITRHDYRRRSKAIENRLSELNRQLAALKSELKTIDPRYDQIARRLERAESEIDALRASEIQMTNQYRTGRISKDVYESLTRDLRKRMEKAKETVDSIIVTLREETR